MKQLELTRKIKQALSEHFSRKGTVNNVTGDLVRVSMEDRLKCYEFWKQRKAR